MPQGARGHIGIKKELTWGTKETGDNDFFLPFVSETLISNIEEVLSAAQKGILDEPESYQGEKSFAGDVVVEVHPASIGHLLRSAINVPETTLKQTTTTWAASTAYDLGVFVQPTTENDYVYECTTAGTSGATEPTWPTIPGDTVTDGTVVWTCRLKVFQHEFTPRQDDFHADCPINPYTLEIYRDQGDAFQFLGAIINTLALNFSTTDKILKDTNGVIAKDLGSTPKTTLALETTDPFIWEQAVISIAGSPNNDIESFGINYDNLCVGKYALNNTAILRKIIRSGFRTIPVNFTIDFIERTEYDKFIAGTKQVFQIKFTGAECEAGENYTFQLDLPKFRYLTYPINMDGPGPIVCGVTGKAKYDASLGYPFKITLINLETGY